MPTSAPAFAKYRLVAAAGFSLLLLLLALQHAFRQITELNWRDVITTLRPSWSNQHQRMEVSRGHAQ